MSTTDLDTLLRLLLGLLALFLLHIGLAAATARICTGKWPHESTRAMNLFRRYL